MPREYIQKAIRDKIKKVANGSCEYCKAIRSYSSSPFAIEHIIPVAQNGSNEFSNLAFSCNHCNQAKHIATTAIDPLTNQAFPLFNPRKQIWKHHFKWSSNFSKMVGLTPIGRASILRLNTNRQENINLRTVLIGIVHPPD